MMRAALLALLLVSATAEANVWQRAIDSSDATKDRYEVELQTGDDLALRANARSQNKKKATELVDQAIESYRAAAALRPDQGEPYFRIASVLASFFVDCDRITLLASPMPQAPPLTCPANNSTAEFTRARQALAAWDAFETRAPLDPRLADALFSRAIMRTKLVGSGTDGKLLLEGALRDYTSLLDRADGLGHVDSEQVWGNLAETYMMLGKMEEAIDAYRVALRLGAGASTAYGLAVALDRDDNYTDAAAVIRAQPFDEFRAYQRAFATGLVFYVPRGEEHYYLALIYQANGYTTDAIQHWRLFLASGAHPQFQARAKHHLDALVQKQRSSPTPAPRPPIDPFDLYP